MIAKWAGRCSICNRAVPKDTDVHYSQEEKTIECWACWENPQPGPAEFALAQRLGYLSFDAALHRNWAMFSLPPSIGSAAARRLESPAPGEQASLWHLSASSESDE